MLIMMVFPSGMSFLLGFLHVSQEISGIQLQFAMDLMVFVKSCGYMKHNPYSHLSFTYFLNLYLIKTPPLQVHFRKGANNLTWFM